MPVIQTTLGLSSRKSSWIRGRDSGRWSRSRRSLYHRMLSGLRKARGMHKQVWFVTLTTSEVMDDVIVSTESVSRDVFKRHFSAFVKRCRRQFGEFEYICVHTSEGHGVYHLLVNSVSIGRNFTFGGFFGFKAFWYWCSEQWLDIHYSPVVWTVLLRGLRKAVNYVIGHYLGGQKGYLRYHWSWQWVFKGFVARWKRLLWRYKDKDGMIAADRFKLLIRDWNKVVYTESLYVSCPQSTLVE